MKNIPKNKIVEDWLEEHGDPEIDKKVEKQLELDEAADNWVFETNGHKWSNNDNTAGDNYGSFKAGAQWQAERMYDEEDLRKAYFSGISSTGEGWNGEYADGNDPNIEEKFSKGFTQWIEQFKKK
jgi:hypothetical protein